MSVLGSCIVTRIKVTIVRPASEFCIRRNKSKCSSFDATYHDRCPSKLNFEIVFVYSFCKQFFPLQNLQVEACQLKSKMAEIQKDIFQVHKETSASMSNLERLDSMKTKLQVCINCYRVFLKRYIKFRSLIGSKRRIARVGRLGKIGHGA